MLNTDRKKGQAQLIFYYIVHMQLCLVVEVLASKGCCLLSFVFLFFFFFLLVVSLPAPACWWPHVADDDIDKSGGHF